MTATFDHLKALLTAKKDLTPEDVAAAIAASGDLTADEKMWLEAEKLMLQRGAQAQITLEQYLAASQVLDNAAPGSPEYQAAETIVNQYEAGM